MVFSWDMLGSFRAVEVTPKEILPCSPFLTICENTHFGLAFRGTQKESSSRAGCTDFFGWSVRKGTKREQHNVRALAFQIPLGERHFSFFAHVHRGQLTLCLVMTCHEPPLGHVDHRQKGPYMAL